MVMVDAMFGRGAEVQGDAVLRTVDQALLAGLPCKFATPRPWGLAQKILIVDEAHEMGRQPKAAARCPAAGVLLCGAGSDRAAGGAGVACLWVRSAVMITSGSRPRVCRVLANPEPGAPGVRTGVIDAPADLHALIVAVHGADQLPVPALLSMLGDHDIATGFPEGDLAQQKLIDETRGYRDDRGAADKRNDPSRLGSERVTLPLARRGPTVCAPGRTLSATNSPSGPRQTPR